MNHPAIKGIPHDYGKPHIGDPLWARRKSARGFSVATFDDTDTTPL